MSRPAALAKLLYYPTENRHARDLGRISRSLFRGLSRRAWVLDPSAGEGAALAAFVAGLRSSDDSMRGVDVPVVSALELDAGRYTLLRDRAADFESLGTMFCPSQGDQFSSSFGSLEGYNAGEKINPTVIFTNPPYHTDSAYGRMEVRFTIDALDRYLDINSEYWRRPTSVHAWSIIPEDSLALLQKHLKDTDFFAALAFRFQPEEYAHWRQVAVLLLPVHYVHKRHAWRSTDVGSLRSAAIEVYDWSYALACADGTSDIQDMIATAVNENDCYLADGIFTQDETPDYEKCNDSARFSGIPGLSDRYRDESPSEYEIRRALCTLSAVPLTSDDYEAIDAANPLHSGRGAAVMLPATAHNFGRPLVPLANGHLALVAAAGVIDGATLVDPALKGHTHPWRIKGLAARATRTWHDINENGSAVKVSREVINVTFTLFCPTTREVISWTAEDNLDEINTFLARNSDQIRNAIELQLPARLSESEARGIKIKARAPAGKTPWGAQLRTIAGAVEGLKDGNVIVCGEQGTGKTFMLSAIARQVAHAVKRGESLIRPIVVMCPGHLVEKWAAEWRDCTGLPATIAQTHEDVLSYADAFRAWVGTTSVPPAFLGASWGFYSGVQRPWVVSRLQGTLPTSAKAHPGLLIVSKETAKLGSPWQWAVAVHNSKSKDGATRVRMTCPTCGMLVNDLVVEKNRDRLSIEELAKLPLSAWPDAAIKPTCRVIKGVEDKQEILGCGAPLWRATRMEARTKQGKARAPLAYTIARKLHGYILILDECQDYTAKTADQSHAANRLATHAWRTIPATGTLTDGLASTLFYLLYWTQPKFREDWKFNDVERFVATHGIVERVTTVAQSTGSMGGRRGDSTTRVTEVPGVDPTLFKYLLGSTVFMRLEDVKPEFEAAGREFPRYEESVEILPCPNDLSAQANDDAEKARKLRFTNPSEAAQLWARSLYGPNSLDADAPVTPKEQRMLELVREQVVRGGKAAIYVTYINKSRTMPRLRELLENNGIRVTTLEQSDSPSTRLREEVLREKIKHADVLITNGTLVQTGLDLLWATLIIQFGAELKTRTLSQQIRRAMRINQPEPLVRVVILAHKGVPEETYTQYVARKIQAAAVMQNSLLDGLAGASESKGYELIKTFRDTFGAD